ncbi:MAG: GAF domain-containing protein, partial [Gammaproteobacteria bacterium]
MMGVTTDLHARHKRLLEQQVALTALTQSPVLHGENLEQAFQLVTETAARLMRIERVSLWRYTQARSAIRCMDLYELSRDRHSADGWLQADRYPAYFQALATSEAIVADDAHADPRTREFSISYLASLGITAMMDMPIHVQGRMAGVLCHEQVGPPLPWTPEDRLLGIAMANLIALAIERSERQRAEEELRKTRDATQDQIREHTAELARASSTPPSSNLRTDITPSAPIGSTGSPSSTRNSRPSCATRSARTISRTLGSEKASTIWPPCA